VHKKRINTHYRVDSRVKNQETREEKIEKRKKILEPGVRNPEARPLFSPAVFPVP
jgi:hypothetical protein